MAKVFQVLLPTYMKATSGLADFNWLREKAAGYQVLLSTSINATSGLADFTG